MAWILTVCISQRLCPLQPRCICLLCLSVQPAVKQELFPTTVSAASDSTQLSPLLPQVGLKRHFNSLVCKRFWLISLLFISNLKFFEICFSIRIQLMCISIPEMFEANTWLTRDIDLLALWHLWFRFFYFDFVYWNRYVQKLISIVITVLSMFPLLIFALYKFLGSVGCFGGCSKVLQKAVYALNQHLL